MRKSSNTMVRTFINGFLLLILITSVKFENCKGELKPPFGIFDPIIKEILESFRPSLVDLKVHNQTFDTGPQEFGNLKGVLQDVLIQGLENFRITILNTSIAGIKNLTIVEDKFSVKGSYCINGTLAFPLGKNDIHLFGNGELWGEFKDLSFSMKITFVLKNGKILVQDLIMFVELGTMNVYLKNLMGGSEFESVFNQLINDIGPTILNYYKKSVLEDAAEKLKEVINEMLNKNSSQIPEKQEL